MPWFVCEICGKSFWKLPSQVRGKMRFCSWYCYKESFGPAIDRFKSKTVPGENGCILWAGRLNEDGYGQFDVGGKSIGAHIFAFEQAHGPVPEGLQLDHKCRVRHCVNEDHLRAVTSAVNILCGEVIAAVNARKTHCIHGHELNDANVYLVKVGKYRLRQCRECHYIHSRNHDRKRRGYVGQFRMPG